MLEQNKYVSILCMCLQHISKNRGFFWERKLSTACSVRLIVGFSSYSIQPYHTSRIWVRNRYYRSHFRCSHQCSHMISQVWKCGYNSKVYVAFWENATFVFWLCKNSWFWVSIFFSITIFHKYITLLFLWHLLFCT